MKKVIKWALIIALFAVCQYYAFLQRGYYAVGGETVIIIAPLMVEIYKGLAEYCKRR